MVLFAICLLVAPITFAIGRWSRSARPNSNIDETRFASEVQILHEPQRTSDAIDFTNVTIENLGEVEFDQAYELLRSAPKEALLSWTKRLEELPVAPRKTAAIKAFFKTLAQIDARTAVDLALGMERTDPRWTAIGAVSVATPAADLSEVARMYTTLNENKFAVVGELIARWSATDPEATARFLASYSGKVPNDEIAAFLWNWAALDPAAATAWLVNTDANRRDPGVYAGFYDGWRLSDPTSALTDLATRAVDKTFHKAVRNVTENLFVDSKEAARAFILTLSGREAQEAAVDEITGHFTRIYFGSADPLKPKPDEVTKWLLTLPDDLWQKEIGHVIEQWANEDEPALEAWYNQMSPKMRDRLLAQQALAFHWNVPKDGFQAGLRISDPELRQNTFREIFKEMSEEGRQETLQKADLSAEQAGEIKRILEHL